MCWSPTREAALRHRGVHSRVDEPAKPRRADPCACKHGETASNGGQLILIDGFRDGFETLTEFRAKVGLSPLVPAAHNFHCTVAELLSAAARDFVVQDTWHTGVYDFLTRIVFPQLAGAENASKPGEFHSRIEPIVRAHAVLEGLSCGRPSSDEALVSKKRDMEQYARVRGSCLPADRSA